MKGGIEGLPDVVLNIGDVLDKGGKTNPLPRNHIKISYIVEGAFVVLLAHENLGDRILEPADKLVTVFRLEVVLRIMSAKLRAFLCSCSRRNSSWTHGWGWSGGLFSSSDCVAWSALSRFSIASFPPSLWYCKLLAL